MNCVVVDDGSTDGTSAIVKAVMAQDDRIQLLEQANAGISAARNAGIAQLPEHCEYVAFIDSDDVWEKDALAILVEALQARPDAVGAYGLADYLDEHGEPLSEGLHPSRQRDRHILQGCRLRPVPAGLDTTFAVMALSGPIWPSAVAIHRLADVNAVGGFDTSFSSQEDWDLYLRLSRRGPYAAIERRVAWYRRHSSNTTSSHRAAAFQHDRVRRNACRSVDNTAAQTRLVARAWRHLELRQSAILGRHSLRCLLRGNVRASAEAMIGAVISGAHLLRPAGPPPAKYWRLRYTQPLELNTFVAEHRRLQTAPREGDQARRRP